MGAHAADNHAELTILFSHKLWLLDEVVHDPCCEVVIHHRSMGSMVLMAMQKSKTMILTVLFPGERGIYDSIIHPSAMLIEEL